MTTTTTQTRYTVRYRPGGIYLIQDSKLGTWMYNENGLMVFTTARKAKAAIVILQAH